MARFGYLKNLEVKRDGTARYTIYQVSVNDVSPTLIVAPATEANKPYFNALLKRAGRTAAQLKSGKVDTRMIAENRTEDRELYPLHIVVGWEDVLDSDGSPVDFSADAAREFLVELPDWVFDDLRNFAGNPANFVDYQFNPEEKGKN